MGGRGVGVGVEGSGLYIGGGVWQEFKDFESAIPLEQYEQLGVVIPSAGRPLTYGGAGQSLNDGLAKSGIKNLTKMESVNVAHNLMATASLFGGGSLRTRLYRTGRLLGDVKAVQGGTGTMVRRIQRRLAGRVTGQTFRKLFK